MKRHQAHTQSPLGIPMGFVRLAEAAKALRVSKRMLRDMMARGELTGYRFGKFVMLKAAELAPRPITNKSEVTR